MDRLQIDRPYPVLCGKNIAFDYSAAYILEHSNVKEASSIKVAIVTDRIVSGYFYNQFENQFIVRNMRPVLVTVDCQEANKGLGTVDSVFKHLNDFGFGPEDWIIALGGGGVLDVASFAASILEGGIHYMAIPTTLCAMTDVGIAPKAYLNSGRHKDMLWSANKPDIILNDPSFLKQVPQKIKFNGYASIIRYAILKDLNLLLKLSDPGDLRVFLNSVYSTRMAIERENPAFLNLGKEIASGIEAYFRFMNYSEGEALALSLLASVDEKKRLPISKIYEAVGLPIRLEGVSGKMIMKTLSDRIKLNGKGIIDMIDLDNGVWINKHVNADEALAICASRLAIISDLENV